MIKIYGMPSCPYCAYVDEQVKGDKRFKECFYAPA